ncbi:MAG: ribbon-helix-helix protein, CopG family [Dongiaceae bacterium]
MPRPMPSRNATLSFRTEEAKAEALDRLAADTERPRSWHLQRALDNYLTLQADQIAHIREGLGQLDRGESVPHEEVIARVDRWKDRVRRKQRGAR